MKLMGKITRLANKHPQAFNFFGFNSIIVKAYYRVLFEKILSISEGDWNKKEIEISKKLQLRIESKKKLQCY